MLKGTEIDTTVIGGPAHNSKAISSGDVILKIDEVVVTGDNIVKLLLGNDLPGSPVNLTIAKGGPKVCFLQLEIPGKIDQLVIQGPVVNVALTRMSTDELVDRRKIFELFTVLKVRHSSASHQEPALTVPRAKDRAVKDKDAIASSTVDETIQLWTKMWEADLVHDQTIVGNVQALLQRARALVDTLQVSVRFVHSPVPRRCLICRRFRVISESAVCGVPCEAHREERSRRVGRARAP
jgi:hypothetical protein